MIMIGRCFRSIYFPFCFLSISEPPFLKTRGHTPWHGTPPPSPTQPRIYTQKKSATMLIHSFGALVISAAASVAFVPTSPTVGLFQPALNTATYIPYTKGNSEASLVSYSGLLDGLWLCAGGADGVQDELLSVPRSSVIAEGLPSAIQPISPFMGAIAYAPWIRFLGPGPGVVETTGRSSVDSELKTGNFFLLTAPSVRSAPSLGRKPIVGIGMLGPAPWTKSVEEGATVEPLMMSHDVSSIALSSV